MKQIGEWDLTQAELKKAANCNLDEQYGKEVDCDHCPVAYFCQDIGYAYLDKFFKYLQRNSFYTKAIPQGNGQRIISKKIGINPEFVDYLLKQIEERYERTASS